MSPRLKITSYVIERLRNISSECVIGCLYGLMYDGTLLVVGLSLETEHTKHSQLLLHLPTEVDLCGVVHFAENSYTDKEILQDVDMTDNPVVLTAAPKGVLKAHFLVHDRLEPTTHEVMSADELRRDFLYVRLQTTMPLVCEATVAGVKNSLQAKRKKIAAGQVSFHLQGTSVYMLGEPPAHVEGEAASEQTIGQLIGYDVSRKKKTAVSHVEIVPVNIVMKATKDIVGEKFVKTAVKMVTTQGKPAYCIKMPLVTDGVALVHLSTRLSQLYSVLVETACRCMRLLEVVLLHELGQEGIGDGAGLTVPETFHFLPPELGHFVTTVLPRGQPDDCSENHRRQLHRLLGLPTNRPFFRRGCAHLPPAAALAAPAPLLSPHEALPADSAREDVVRALVRGRYTYHHYKQGGVDDDGWGCAYRSLQTLCSWFRLQGYTNERIPTHREIQQCLVDIGDKPSSFVGSRQWIGSTEVSFCLDSLLGVQSRILFCSSGATLSEYAPELVHHFQTHGSPVMIGGGVLAHTILGVEYNTASQDARYLVLDPHYPGPDDLNTVIGKGWCAWKGSSFWDKTAHYNLCLPQTRPCL